MNIRYFYLVLVALGLSLVACKEKKAEAGFIATGDQAVDDLSRKIEKAPLQADNYFQRASVLYEKEEYARVIADMEKALAIDSLNPSYYHLLADGYMDYYRSKDALATMRKLLKIYPDRVPSLLKLAELEYIVKRHDVSIYNCNLILKDNPQNAEAFFMLGLNFKELGETQKAINSFQTAVENNPDLLDAWIIIADMYAEQGDDKALDYYNSAIMLAPDKPEMKHSKAFYLQNNGKVEEAKEMYRDVIISTPSYGLAFLNLGVLYLQQDSIDLAFEQFDILASREPTNPNAFFYRAQTHFIKGDMEAAKVDLQNTLRLNSEDKDAQGLLDEVLMELAG